MVVIGGVTINISGDSDPFIRALTKAVSGATKALGGLAAAGLKIGAITIAAGAAAGAISGIAALASKAAGALAVLPAAFAALGAGVAAVKIGMDGVGEALKNLDPANAEQLAKAMEKLAPNAQEFVRTMQGLKPAWDELKKAVQDKLFEGMGESMQNLADKQLPVLKKGLEGIATEINAGVRAAFAELSTDARAADFTTIFAGAQQLFHGIGQAMAPVVGALVDIATVGSEFVGGAGAGIQSWAEKFQATVAQMRADGSLKEMMQTGIDAAKALFGAIGDVIHILTGVGKAAMEAGTFGGFLEALDKINEWVNSFAGQNALVQFFQEVNGAVGALLPSIDDLANALFTGLVPVVAEFVKGVGPSLEPVLQALSAGFAELLPAMLPLGQAIGAILEALAPLIPVIAQVAAAFATVLSVILQALAPVLQWLSEFLLSNKDIIGAFAAAISAIAIPVAAIVVAFKAWVFIKDAILAARAAMIALNLTFLVTPIGLLVIAITGLVAGLVYFFAKTETGKKIFQGFVDRLSKGWEYVKVAFAVAWEVIKGIFDAFITVAKFLWENVLSPIFTALKYALAVVLTVFLLWWEGVKFVFNAWAALARWVWDTVLSPIWELMKAGFQLLGEFFVMVWESWIKPAWDALGIGIQFVWDTIISPVWELMKTGLQLLGDFFVMVWESWIKPAWDALGIGIQFVWDNVISPVWELIKAGLSLVGAAFSAIWNNVIKPVWDGLGAGISAVWENVISPAWEAMKSGLQAVGDFFGTVVDGIKKVWDGLKKILAIPINFFLETVWNNGIAKAWNTAADLLGLDARAPTFDPVKFATGGVLPGYTPGRDVHTFVDPASGMAIALSGGEAIMRPEVTRAIGVGAVDSLNAAAQIGGVGAVQKTLRKMHFATGGAIDSNLWGIVQQEAPGGAAMTLTSAYRPGDPGHHGAAQAIDVSNGGDAGTPEMNSVAKYMYENYGAALAELIHWPLAGWENIDEGRAFDFGSATNEQHRNHVHIASRNVLNDKVGGPAGSAASPEQQRSFLHEKIDQLLEDILSPARALVVDLVGAAPPEFRNMPPAFMDSRREALSAFLAETIDNMTDGLTDAWNKTKEFFSFDQGGIMPSGKGGFNSTGRPERVLTPAQTEAFDAFVGWITGKNDWNRFTVELGEAIGEACAKPVAQAAESGTKAGAEAAAAGGGGTGIGSSPIVANAAAGMIEELTEGMLRHDDTLYDERNTGLTDAELEQRKKEQWESVFGPGSADNISFADVNGRNAIRWNGQVGHDMGDRAGQVSSGSGGSQGTVQQGPSNTTTVHAPITYQGDADFDTLLRDFGSRLLALLDH